MNQARLIFASFPEVIKVISEIGRPDDGTDTGGFGNTEYFVDLKPKAQWRPVFHEDKEALIAAMNREISKLPGAAWNFSQPIEDNVGETVTGTKGQLALKIFGNDLRTLEEKGEEVIAIMKPIPGITDVKLYRDIGQPNLNFTIDRQQAARFGVNVSDIQDVIETAVGGKAVSQVLPAGIAGAIRRGGALSGTVPEGSEGHRQHSPAFTLGRARLAGTADQNGGSRWRL